VQGCGKKLALRRGIYEGRDIWIAIDVDDAEAKYWRLGALNAPIELPLCDELWGDRHFVVRDPNGIGVDVVQRIATT
jgi:uncharacterized glyoxalase superfamily protein PhnB